MVNSIRIFPELFLGRGHVPRDGGHKIRIARWRSTQTRQESCQARRLCGRGPPQNRLQEPHCEPRRLSTHTPNTTTPLYGRLFPGPPARVRHGGGASTVASDPSTPFPPWHARVRQAPPAGILGAHLDRRGALRNLSPPPLPPRCRPACGTCGTGASQCALTNST